MSAVERDPRKLIGRRMVVELTNGAVFEDVPAEVSPSTDYVRFENRGWMRSDTVLAFEELTMLPLVDAPVPPTEPPAPPARRRREKL